jgi:alpha-L-fucosidase
MKSVALLACLALAASGQEKLERFNEAKFGMFIHWGPYSLASVEASWPIMTPSKPPQISEAEYRALPARFNPVNFDAQAWVKLARDAGQRYIVLTSKHHDGFCMFDCAGTDYKITRTPYGKDIAAQLAEAAKAEGIPLGFYYSPPDMNHSGFRDTTRPSSANWQGEPLRPEWPGYLDYMDVHLRQLLTGYGPIFVVWFDGLGQQEMYDGARFHKLIYGLQPQALINNRIGLTGDYVTPEQRVPQAIPVRGAKVGNTDPKDAGLSAAPPRKEDFQPWESCMTINGTWAYNKNDLRYKSTTELVRTLIEVASRGGNFLLNVGPAPDGTIQPEFAQRLREMGTWLRANGESIYGTTYGPLQGVPGVRTTAKGGTVYVHVFDWPRGELALEGLPAGLVDAQVLSSGERLPLKREGTRLLVSVPLKAPDSMVTVIALRPLRFPKPDPEKAFPGVEIPAPAARRAPDRAEVDAWMAAQHDRVEWVAGWWHDFVNPADGAFLTWTPTPPPGATPKVMGGWVFGFRSRHVDKIVQAAELAQSPGGGKYADWASAQLDFYAANYLKWPLQTAHGNSRLMFQSLDDAVVLTKLVKAARMLPGGKRAYWYGSLFKPMAEQLDESMQRVHNIAVWQRSAMAVAALYGRDDALYRRAIDGPYGIRRQLQDGVTSDYLWFEQSILYNDYVASALAPLFEVADLPREKAIARNLSLAPLFLRFPDGMLPTPADSTNGLRRVTGTRLPEVTSRNLESSRMAVIKEGPWQVYFHYGQLDSSHSQAEALNYEAYHEATAVTHDSGTVGYGSPLHRGYYTAALAHNVPVIDGLGQARWQSGELISYAPNKVAARQPLYRADASAERTLEIRGGELIDIVTVKSVGHNRRLGLLVHVQGDVELPPSFQPGGDLPESFTYFESPKSALAGRQLELPVRFAGKKLKLSVQGSGPMRVTHGIVPDAPPAKRQVLYFETRGAEAQFVTRWAP